MGEGNREKILSVKDVARLKCCSPESILNDIQKKNPHSHVILYEVKKNNKIEAVNKRVFPKGMEAK